MWGNDKSGSDVAVGCLAEALALMLQLVVWLKHCFGVLVIFDCCFVMMEPLQL